MWAASASMPPRTVWMTRPTSVSSTAAKRAVSRSRAARPSTLASVPRWRIYPPSTLPRRTMPLPSTPTARVAIRTASIWWPRAMSISRAAPRSRPRITRMSETARLWAQRASMWAWELSAWAARSTSAPTAMPTTTAASSSRTARTARRLCRVLTASASTPMQRRSMAITIRPMVSMLPRAVQKKALMIRQRTIRSMTTRTSPPLTSTARPIPTAPVCP